MYANSVKDVVAQLPVLDFAVAKNFYCNEIGIRLVDEFDDLLIFLWNDAELHLWKCNEPLIPKYSSVYVRVSDIDALYKLYSDKQVSQLIEISDRPWGMREFYIIDPFGNLLKFGEAIV